MTTIAANKDCLVYDLQLTTNTGVKMKTASKIYVVEKETASKLFNCDEAVIGFAGNVTYWGKTLEWFTDVSEPLPKLRDIEFLMLTSKRKIYTSRNLKNWVLVDQPYHAIGSGSQFALGALAASKTPMEAVKIASKHDVYTGMGFKQISLS